MISVRPDKVRIVEVGPRDGLQNESVVVPAEVKIALIDRLAAAGLSNIEATSFVSPKWVPQMADAAAVMAGIARTDGVRHSVLVPNLKGLESALASNCEEIAVFIAASESFSRRNINCSIAESLDRIKPVCAAALQQKLHIRGYISCVLGCPYGEAIQPQNVAALAQRLMNLGCYEVSLGDTIGVGTPDQALTLIAAVARQGIPLSRIAVHFHDTYGQALANIYACVQAGISVVDSSVAGLGGCPYAPGATGNVASEDVVYMLHGCGISTGIDLDRLIDAGAYISDFLRRPSGSRVARAILAKRTKTHAS